MSAPNEDDIEEEYDEDFEEEPQKDEGSGKKQNEEQQGAGKAKSYTFVLLDGDEDKGSIELATDSKWSEFLAAAESKLGSPVTAITYEHDFGAAKTKSKHCKEDNEWNEVLAMMEENASHLQGKLRVHVSKASKKPDTVEAKPEVKEDASVEAAKGKSMDAKGKSMDAPAKQPVAAPASSASSNMYTFVLFEGEEEKAEVKMAHNCTWTEMLAAAKTKLGYEVGWILYDDNFGDKQEQDIKCQNQEDWEDLLIMMEEDAVHIKGELDIEVCKKPASNAGAADSKAASEKASVSTTPPPALTLRCYDGNTHIKDLRVQPSTTWDEILKQLAGMQHRPHSFEYKEGGSKIKVSDSGAWTACLKLLNANKTMDVFIISSESSIASSTKHIKGSAKSATVSESGTASMDAGHYTPATLKLSHILENALISVIQHRDEIISACNQRDKTHTGTCSQDELAKRIRKSALCREEVAQEIAAVCQAEPGGIDAIDYALLLRRFRYGELLHVCVCVCVCGFVSG
jgi:hypothetical protein